MFGLQRATRPEQTELERHYQMVRSDLKSIKAHLGYIDFMPSGVRTRMEEISESTLQGQGKVAVLTTSVASTGQPARLQRAPCWRKCL